MVSASGTLKKAKARYGTSSGTFEVRMYLVDLWRILRNDGQRHLDQRDFHRVAQPAGAGLAGVLEVVTAPRALEKPFVRCGGHCRPLHRGAQAVNRSRGHPVLGQPCRSCPCK